ncbi:MAG: DegT/DnrJ/EryC1/StrS family aminotransferase [Candidatus Omnitrophica bacterium]|nr:DegT/DnrJ/EryC1/StrS family aminotransferase [Candidatus Omnitrophota bacterium]
MKNIPRFIPSLTINDIRSTLFTRRHNAGSKDSLAVFTKQFADYIGVSCAVPTPSARVALKWILHALELPKGGEVILPSLIFHCIPAIFREFGLQPRFVDIDPKTYCIDTDRIEPVITSSTVAIFPVHLYGRVCDMRRIKAIAARYNLVIIEDCAQSCGASYSGKRAGSFGQAAIFSFSPHKNIPVLGMGMAVTGSYALAEKISSWMKQSPCIGSIALTKNILYAAGMRFVTRPWFWDSIMSFVLNLFDRCGIDLIEALTSESPGNDKSSSKGISYLPTPFYGKIGLSQLLRLELLNQKRIYNGNKLLEYLQDIAGIELPVAAGSGENIYSSFVIRTDNRQLFRSRLRKIGIDTHGGNMSVGPHLLGFQEANECKNAFDAVKRMVHLPVYPEMEDSDLSKIAKAVKTVAEGIGNHEFSR